MKLKCVKIGFDAQCRFAGWTEKVRISGFALLIHLLDDLYFVARKSPDRATITTFPCILRKTIGVQVDVNMFSAFAKWAFHNLLLFIDCSLGLSALQLMTTF
jgi:hypothetical protein